MGSESVDFDVESLRQIASFRVQDGVPCNVEWRTKPQRGLRDSAREMSDGGVLVQCISTNHRTSRILE